MPSTAEGPLRCGGQATAQRFARSLNLPPTTPLPPSPPGKPAGSQAQRTLLRLASAAMPDAPRQLPSPVGILDNRSRGLAGDFLQAHLKEGTELSVVSAYFTISAYEALREELERVERMRFLYGAPDHLQALGRGNRPTRASVPRVFGFCYGTLSA